MEFFFVVVES